MKLKIFFTVSLLLIIGFYIWYKLIYYYEPQTILYRSTSIPIPHDAKLVKFERENNDFNGDGNLLIIYNLTTVEVEQIALIFKARRYKSLPVKDFFFPLGEMVLNDSDKGFYNINQMDNSVLILNKSKNLIVYYVIFK
jgi:hypothetical protein